MHINNVNNCKNNHFNNSNNNTNDIFNIITHKKLILAAVSVDRLLKPTCISDQQNIIEINNRNFIYS